MQKMILKAGKSERFRVVLATLDKDSSGKHKVVLSVTDSRYPYAVYEAAEICMTGRSKETLLKIAKDIAGLFPPVETIRILDLEEADKLGEK